MPEVDVHYAVKVNPHDAILKTLMEAGCGFDASSPGEFEHVFRLGGEPEHVILSHPIKTPTDIVAALDAGINMVVADNLVEIDKFKGIDVQDTILQLRVAHTSKASKYDFSQKFGVVRDTELLELAEFGARRGFKKFGLAFHTGSQNTNPESFRKALELSAVSCEKLRKAGFDMVLVNMGGGFPSRDVLPDHDIGPFVAVFRDALDQLLDMGLKLKAEPGRYLVATALDLHCSVVGKAVRNSRPWYYVNDNIYNALAGKWGDKATYKVTVPNRDSPLELSALAGNTEDSVDIIEESIWLPKLEIGDRLIFHDLGAYNSVFAVPFNGIPITPTIVVHGQENYI